MVPHQSGSSAPSPRTSGENFRPFVSADSNLPELTWRAVLFGVFFAILFGTASAYVAVKAGLTAGASIPCALVSMALLKRLFKSSILENNMVQTIGSAGESVASSAIFTIPALLFLGQATGVSYFQRWQIFTIAIVGGLLGVLFMIPLRKTLIVREHKNLLYPEGTACADVLIAGEKSTDVAKPVFTGTLVGVVYWILMKLLGLWKEVATLIPTTKLSFYKNASLSIGVTPEYLGVGYIIGPRAATQMVVGGLLAWLVFIPLFSVLPEVASWLGMKDPLHAILDYNAAPAVLEAARQKIDFMVSHQMLPTGDELPIFNELLAHARNPEHIANVASFSPALVDAVQAKFQLALSQHMLPSASEDYVWGILRQIHLGKEASPDQFRKAYVIWIAIGAVVVAGVMNLARTIPMVLRGFGKSMAVAQDKLSTTVLRTQRDLPSWVVLTGAAVMAILIAVLPGMPGKFPGSLLISALIMFFGFFFVTVSSRFVGMVAYSAEPVTPIANFSAMLTCFLFIALGWTALYHQPMVVIIAAVVCLAAGNAGATSQDLKTGFLVGSTPWKQQIGLVIGVCLSAVVMSGILILMDQSVPGLQHALGSDKFPAPQANILATLIQAFLSGKIPWRLLAVGACIAVLSEVAGFVSLSIAAGLYLPVETTLVIFVGGLIRWLVQRKKKSQTDQHEEELSPGMLYATGFVAGGAVTGMLLGFAEGRLPKWFDKFFNVGRFYLDETASAKHILLSLLHKGASFVALGAFACLCIALYRRATRSSRKNKTTS